jgi:hypothetical protein
METALDGENKGKEGQIATGSRKQNQSKGKDRNTNNS